jgi:protein-tyrosine-phosphatase
MAAGLLASLAEADVASAGLLPGGMPATDHARSVLADRGLDLGGHLSRTLTAEHVRDADLVVTMERRHAAEAVVLVPEAEAWTFTLRDLVARAETNPPRADGESVRGWAARLAAGRPRSALLGTGDDAVDDPIGKPRRAYERTAADLDDLLRRLVERGRLAPATKAVAS